MMSMSLRLAEGRKASTGALALIAEREVVMLDDERREAQPIVNAGLTHR
jgi:hypothetical protein